MRFFRAGVIVAVGIPPCLLHFWLLTTDFQSASLFDGLAIDDGRAEAADDVGVVAGELEPVNKEEAPEPGCLAGGGADLGAKQVVSQQRGPGGHPQITLALD